MLGLKLQPKAVGLAEKLLKFKKDIASLTLIPAGGGVFEVMANDQLVYSKVATGEFDPDQVVEFANLGQLARATLKVAARAIPARANEPTWMVNICGGSP